MVNKKDMSGYKTILQETAQLTLNQFDIWIKLGIQKCDLFMTFLI